jgi:hypothetical protein
MKTLLKPLSLALFVAATLPTQSAYIRTSPPSDTIPATGSSPYFCKAIGGPSIEAGNSLIQTSDGGYAIAGSTTSFGPVGADVYLVKLDANGNLQWTKTIGGPNYEEGRSLIQTSDGGYAIAGETYSFGAGGYDVYVVKLDANGNLQWTKTIDGPNYEEGRSLIQTSDGGYAIAGYTRSFGAGEADVYVVKLDANGNLQWTKTIGGKNDEESESLIQTADGGYAIAGYTIAGYTEYSGAGESDVYVVKLDAKGNLQWSKTIRGKGWDVGLSLIQTSDGGYAIAGYTSSFGAGSGDVYVVKLDAKGNLQWTKTIGGPESDGGFSLIQTSDGGYAIAGETTSFGAGWNDVYVVKLDANGNLQWSKTIGGKNSDWGNSLIQTSDGGYAIAGVTQSFGAGQLDVYVVKLDKNGDACCAVSQTSQSRVRWQAKQRYPLHRQRRHLHLPHPQHQLRRHPHQPVPIAPPPYTTPRSTLPSRPVRQIPFTSPHPLRQPRKSPHRARLGHPLFSPQKERLHAPPLSSSLHAALISIAQPKNPSAHQKPKKERHR